MEDRHTLANLSSALPLGVLIMGVFDGHRGVETAQDLCDMVPNVVVDLLKDGRHDLERRASDAFCRLDADIRQKWGTLSPAPRSESCPSSPNESPTALRENPADSQPVVSPLTAVASPITGSTANVAVVLNDAYIFFNVGDSRSYLIQYREGKQTGAKTTVDNEEDGRDRLPDGTTIVITSTDHRPSNEEEAQRVIQNGGAIINGRVNGKLSVSRAFGDFDLKPNVADAERNPVTCVPEVQVISRLIDPIERGPDHRGLPVDYDLVLVGCDGVWELQHVETIVKRFREKLSAAKLAGDAASDTDVPTLPSLISDVICDTLGAACAPSSDPSGGTPGSDNMTFGMAVITR
jgi:serine/threonine protein phosphatase PrpC